MRCLKCKEEIPDNLLECTFCKTKLKTVCPICGAKNLITEEFCTGCGLQLLKYCEKCNAVNLPNFERCRKCSNLFENDEALVSISDLQKKSVEKISNDACVEFVEKEIPDSVSVQVDEVSEEENDLQNKKELNDEDYIIDLEKPVDDPQLDIASNVYEKNIDQEVDSNRTVDAFKMNELDEFELDNLINEEHAQQIVDEANIKQSEQNVKEELTELDRMLAEKEDEPISIEEQFKKENLIQEQDVITDIKNKSEILIEDSEDTVVDFENSDIQQEIITAQDETSSAVLPDAMEQGPQDVPEIQNQTFDQMKCKNLIIKAIKSSEKLIIGMSAPEGRGKSTVLKYLFGELVNQNYAWLWSECSANSQISPFGIFQEMILTFFNMPNFSNMSQEFIKQAKNMLSKTFPVLTQDEINNLFNFLYPSLTSNFEEILLNKDRTFILLEKLILEISKKAKLIIVVDDFDMIDGASYEFLSYFVNKGYLGENIELVITYKDNRVTQGYFYSEKIAQNQYEDIRLDKLTIQDADNFIKIHFNNVNPLPEEFFNQIFHNSFGNSAYIEQVLVLLQEYKAVITKDGSVKYRQTALENRVPKNINEILSLRLKYLQKRIPLAYKALCTAAIMGNKFNIRLLEIILQMEPQTFHNVMKILCESAYVSQFNSNIFEFKNTIVWKYIYERAKQSDDFVLLNEKIFGIISSFTLSSNALKALIAQSLSQKLLALNIWTDNIKLCAYLGDEHLWTLSQKQCLKIVQEIKTENNEVIINNIQERLGKLLYMSRPTEAIIYLSNAIDNAIKVNNSPKVIELSGYLSKSCSLTGNYNGVIEAIDTILKIVETPENRLETALIKHKKLKALFAIGNSEEIYNLASNEIIPIVEQALSEVIPNNDISMNIIYETWLECNLTVAQALIIQGNKKAFDVLNLIDEIVLKNNVNNKKYLQRLQLTKALAFSIQGRIQNSDDILVEFTQSTAKEFIEPEIISLWNFINILNKIYKREWTNIKEDLYSVVTFANNYNDVLVKNLLKVFLGKILQEEGNLSRALDIFNEQVAIFAREKIAVGALLCWYYIAKITLVTDGTDKALEIAQKALDVAKNPKISNYYFVVLYKKLIAEIYLIKGDMEATKMYIEKALMIVKQYDMKYLKVELYQLYAKYLEEMVSKKPQNKVNYAQNAISTYQKVLIFAQDLSVPAIFDDLNKHYASFKAFCQLNDIPV